jgi:hypothetical protein
MMPVEAPSRCDGCARGLPVVNGAHLDEGNWPAMVCTAERYSGFRRAAASDGNTEAEKKP